MSIWTYRGQKETIANRGILVKAIYARCTLVYQAVTSCFLAGFWDNKDCWNNNVGWFNKKK